MYEDERRSVDVDEGGGRGVQEDDHRSDGVEEGGGHGLGVDVGRSIGVGDAGHHACANARGAQLSHPRGAGTSSHGIAIEAVSVCQPFVPKGG